MGLFQSLFRPINTASVGVNGNLEEFLTKVDSLYMESYNLRSVKNISKFMTREAAGRLNAAVISMNNRYFGDPKFRNTTWTRQSGDELVVLKEVTYDKVHIAGNLNIAVASPYKELWTLITDGGSYKVSKIQLVR